MAADTSSKPVPPPYDSLINILSGHTPPINLPKKLLPLVFDSQIPDDRLLRAANVAISFETKDILELVPWADDPRVVDLRKRVQDNVRAVHDLNVLDGEEEWELEYRSWTQDAIVEAVRLRREWTDLLDVLKGETTEKDTA